MKFPQRIITAENEYYSLPTLLPSNQYKTLSMRSNSTSFVHTAYVLQIGFEEHKVSMIHDSTQRSIDGASEQCMIEHSRQYNRQCYSFLTTTPCWLVSIQLFYAYTVECRTPPEHPPLPDM